MNEQKKRKKFQFEDIEDAITIVAMLIMLVAIGINIAMNWTMEKRYGQLEELGTAAYMFGCYAGIALLYKRRELTDVTFVVNIMPAKLRWFVELFKYAYLVFFSVILTYQGIILCMNSTVKKLTALQIPYIYLDVCIVFGFGLLAIRASIDLVKHVTLAKQTFTKGVDRA